MKEIITSIRRTPYQSLGSFSILFFTLMLFLFFFSLTSFFHSMLNYVETRPQVIVYFDVDAKETDILRLKSQVEQSGKAASVGYVSQKEALKIYKGLNKDNPLLLEMVSEKILPASLEVYAKKPEYLAQIAKDFEGVKIVDEVNYQQVIVEKLITLTTILRRIALGLFVFLTFISMTVLLTTTAFKISVKRDEIEVLRLIGATKWYIRKPFLAEGLFFGLVSGTIAFSLFYALYFSLSSALSSYLAGIPPLAFYDLQWLNLYVYPPTMEYIGMTYLAVVFFGMAMGLIGNYIATSKYIT
ncbi:hypothetical protein A3B02_00400 [Candidatus Roizmanbacteria bacterium RIFCSPLOWO2_01_FULL_42_14]|uniref:Cell division protein FtsX n=3 Tax=Candidatus Roizmaniibacteriota TaxID=1752723 RepID=A0A1F7JZZ9_9BACT|nr:MAG: hypothetical protein A3D08_02600 [Candidatus Roizmanbacteria bacterium RIFCSPHIGHO2_02_FULL_43_11]OGK52715.1 MAG: hypothetical protein A3B02_00400 [Candidatus Roizmanbacteria bacterium RIFCSPLOWO2_01_FULL_42_14]OGK61182.1 MAG: hypothetical protein A3I56_03760 [Candidatus Roizmanbacteria bacterium RIFCSPLOWO2_02_FULL_43_10]